MLVCGILTTLFVSHLYDDYQTYLNRPVRAEEIVPVLPNQEFVIQIEEPKVPAIEQAQIYNIEGLEDIPYVDEEGYFVPIFEAPRVLPNMQMSDHAPFAFPEQYPEEHYAPLPIEQGHQRFSDSEFTYIDEEEEEPEYQDTYL